MSLLPADASIGRIALRVADLERALSFYRDQLGLVAVTTAPDTVQLNTSGGSPLLALTAMPNTRNRPQGAVGLYHVALLFPSRRELGKVLLHLFEARWAFHGFADHAVSEAAYLSDPDGNGIELYSDRPSADWPRVDGTIAMTTFALNVNSLIRAVDGEEWNGAHARTRVGHLHLHVTDLERAERFYREVIGFEVTNRSYPGAVFLAVGGYHHHLGLNTWLRDNARAQDVAGLLSYELVVQNERERDALLSRARAQDIAVEQHGDSFSLFDPDGNRIIVRG
jgi:catechol 2,3-dioxygenase